MTVDPYKSLGWRREIHWLLTDKTAWRWWFYRLVIARVTGQRAAAKRYRRMHGLDERK